MCKCTIAAVIPGVARDLPGVAAARPYKLYTKPKSPQH